MSRRPVTIVVTQEHIDRGEKLHSAKCALALAVQESEIGDETSTVSYTFINCKLGLLNTPRHLKEFISNFDMGLPVEPFTFEL